MILPLRFRSGGFPAGFSFIGWITEFTPPPERLAEEEEVQTENITSSMAEILQVRRLKSKKIKRNSNNNQNKQKNKKKKQTEKKRKTKTKRGGGGGAKQKLQLVLFWLLFLIFQ